MISQLAENPKLWLVFEELFSVKGLKINVSSILNYSKNNKITKKKKGLVGVHLMGGVGGGTGVPVSWRAIA